MSDKLRKDAERWQALMEYARIEHVDDRDMEPIFEVRLPVSWLKADHGFVKAVDAMIKEQKGN